MKLVFPHQVQHLAGALDIGNIVNNGVSLKVTPCSHKNAKHEYDVTLEIQSNYFLTVIRKGK